jgi:hypothetical protein
MARIFRKADLIRKTGYRRNKVMSALSIFYPVNKNTKQAIDQYPKIGNAFRLPDSGPSEFEIVRLLSNTHYEHIHRFLKFIDNWLDVSGPIGRKLIKAKHPFELEQAAAELETFVHLYERFETAVQAVESAGNPVSADVEVQFDPWMLRIEVYTPVDFMGFQLFERYLPMVLKYLDVPRGYHLKIKTQPLQQAPARPYHPYTFPEENKTHEWLSEFAERARQWLSNESPTKALRMPGPSSKVDIVVEIVELDSEPGNRQIVSTWATRSTDTKLYFEVGTPQDTAKSPWGRKLKNKLKKKQCGELTERVQRMLLVNFAMADTGWPHFISGEKFGERFREVIHILDDDKQLYDVVLPAQLGYECCFGRPVWINAHWKETVGGFIAEAGFDRPCVRSPDSIPQEVEDLCP